jgi:hypothetical protein
MDSGIYAVAERRLDNSHGFQAMEKSERQARRGATPETACAHALRRDAGGRRE